MSYSLRPAEKKDTGGILRLIKELADYEKMTNEVVTSENALIQNLFGTNPAVHALMAEMNNKAVGFALYFFNFSTFLGRQGLYLEDLYVQSDFRGHGLGRGL